MVHLVKADGQAGASQDKGMGCGLILCLVKDLDKGIPMEYAFTRAAALGLRPPVEWLCPIGKGGAKRIDPDRRQIERATC